MSTNPSEVAQFRQRQMLEEQAARLGLEGLAVVASHASITARMERMGRYIQQLTEQGKHEEVRAILLNDDLWTAGEKGANE